MPTKLPPIEKIPEAYSAIADGRVRMSGEARAVIGSSGGDKEYTVTWEDGVYRSDDSATFWQGYPGYPVLAVLMLRGLLPFNQSVALSFKGIRWAELNRKYKRDYAKAALEALACVTAAGGDADAARAEIGGVYEALKSLDIMVGRPRRVTK